MNKLNRSKKNSPQYWRIVSVLGISAALMFIAILADILTAGPLSQLDSTVYQTLQAIRTPILDSIMIGITELGDAIVVACVSTAILIVLLVNRAWHTATFWLIAIVGATLINTSIKGALQRSRPIEDLYTGVSNFSFPSGHSTMNFVMYGFIALILCRQLAIPKRIVSIVALLSIGVLIAFSRVYLGAHWATDVLASIALGTTWIALLSLFYLRREPENFKPTAIIQTLCIALLVCGLINVKREHNANLINYKVVIETNDSLTR